MVLNLTVVAIHTFLHIYYGFYVACGYFHNNGYTNIAINLFKLIDYTALCQILHAYINSGNDISTIDRRCVHDVKELVQHLTSMSNTVGTAQNRVVSQLQTAACSIFCTEHVAQGTLSQRTIRALASIEFLVMESAGKLTKLKYW